MKIISSHNTRSRPVERWSQIKKDVGEMLELINGTFDGKWKTGIAISHCQVSGEPLNFFTLHRDFVHLFGGHEVICNLEIVEGTEPVRFQEACLSFPHRDIINTKRHSRLLVDCTVPKKLLGMVVGLEQVRLDLTDLAAFIAQHEYDHSRGINIYEKFKK